MVYARNTNPSPQAWWGKSTESPVFLQYSYLGISGVKVYPSMDGASFIFRVTPFSLTCLSGITTMCHPRSLKALIFTTAPPARKDLAGLIVPVVPESFADILFYRKTFVQ